MSKDEVAVLAPAAHMPAHAAEHLFGNVADDWAAAEVWLAQVADNSRNASQETVATYRFHLAKLRWYVDQVGGGMPSQWSVQEVKDFRDFLANLPNYALSVKGARLGEDGYTPFRVKPAASSQADILRFVRAMLTAFHAAGYIRIHPMALMRSAKPRRIDVTRSVPTDLYDLILCSMAAQPHSDHARYQRYWRDRFVLIWLRETGIRASELAGAQMQAVYRLSDPRAVRTYWMMRVDEAHAKGARARSIPLTREAIDALMAYRTAFGLPALPAPGETQALVLSTKTVPMPIGAGHVKAVADRRYFGAWNAVSTRQAIYKIVKTCVQRAVSALQEQGRFADAAQLRKASPHWLRHTFAKGALLQGHDIRHVAAALGHTSIHTTMTYTEQDALDQIRAWEQIRPGTLAEDL
ncbi:tyrosine-type recombinase/integrase [Janthinobacterium sp.]|uniref:tyrosine-type recombinase/integrase n=1 Tax=Janthinobacterium sp. TaxID=1871054 RepID=UPI002582922D|nr:tyrosine-type recombinase/integrase [Janthinobacterium sp.]MCX7293660.1 tyrosine-type recombinase/integrase [Janthinobacterium sp.]